tara:strand:- start:1454 stop:2317 length:864 start_codon:yes stop_codon:yes gene_type:complete
MDLAIVIPYFKKAHFEETLNSLKCQTNQNFNVYIGDDASPESPVFLINQLELQERFNYHRFDQNLGGKTLTKQWERCLDLVHGEENWVMILCDDDVLSDNCIQEFFNNQENIKKHSSNAIRFATKVIDGNGKALSKIYNHPRLELASDFLVRKEGGGTRSSLSEYIFKAELIKSKGFIDLDLGWYSDVLAVLEISGGHKIFTINEAIVFFRKSPNSISGNASEEYRKTKSLLRYYSILLLNFSNSFKDDDLRLFKGRFLKILFENKRSIYSWQLFLKTILLPTGRFS